MIAFGFGGWRREERNCKTWEECEGVIESVAWQIREAVDARGEGFVVVLGSVVLAAASEGDGRGFKRWDIGDLVLA